MLAMEDGEAAGGDRRGRQSAAMVLTTEAVITEVPNKNGGGMGGGMSPDMY